MSNFFPLSVKDKYSPHLVSLLKILDGVTTWNFLRYGFKEGNPLIVSLLPYVGIVGTTLIVTIGVLLYVYGLRWVYDQVDHWLLRFSCDLSYNAGVGVSIMVIIWNLVNTYIGLLYRPMLYPY